MIELFISYSQFDRDKVAVLERELKDHKLFKPLIIASNREALKPLAKKVTDGIKAAEIIIPILTKQSIVTQWINQEIGYATAIDKKIMPIVDVKIIDELKGFIHKQIDLPYGYTSHVGKNIEMKNFTKAVRDLISDLEETYNKSLTITKPKKTGFDGTV